MGQKVHPRGFRLGVSKDWSAKWFAKKQDFADCLHEDMWIRQNVAQQFTNAGIDDLIIERNLTRIRITVYTAKPGVIIGTKGEKIKKVRTFLRDKLSKDVDIIIEPLDNPDLSAKLAAESIARQIEQRVRTKRAMRLVAKKISRSKALGVKICVKGRLDGGEMAHVAWHREGRVPLHTLRADVDYGFSEAATTYGNVGVKVWVYKGDVYQERGR
jgi:small subunit ribosomal protein S3